jgi:hypothetical protein
MDEESAWKAGDAAVALSVRVVCCFVVAESH